MSAGNMRVVTGRHECRALCDNVLSLCWDIFYNYCENKKVSKLKPCKPTFLKFLENYEFFRQDTIEKHCALDLCITYYFLC